MKKSYSHLLLFAGILFLASNAGGQVRFGHVPDNAKITFEGNSVVFGKSIVTNLFGKERRSAPLPRYVNGQRIYNVATDDVTTPAILNEHTALDKYIITHLRTELSLLPDGTYTIPVVNLVVAPNGKLAYFDFLRIQTVGDALPISSTNDNGIHIDTSSSKKSFSAESERRVYSKLYNLLKNMRFTPALNPAGKEVYCYIFQSTFSFSGFITVKAGKVSYKEL